MVLNPNFGLTRKELELQRAAMSAKKDDIVETVINSMLDEGFCVNKRDCIVEPVIKTEEAVVRKIVAKTSEKAPKLGTNSYKIYTRLLAGEPTGMIVKEMKVNHSQVRYVKVKYLNQ